MQNIKSLLQKVDLGSALVKPLWGEMNLPQMFDHLRNTFQLSRIPFHHSQTPRYSSRSKWLLLDEEFPKSVPLAEGIREKLLESNSDSALNALNEFKKELVTYEEYITSNPNHEQTHPVFGTLNVDLWNAFHYKHISHHFSQFGIV